MGSDSPDTGHFSSESEFERFVQEVSSEYKDLAVTHDSYEAATAIFEDFELCPWSVTSYVRAEVPFDELAGPDPRDRLRNEAILAIESALDKQLSE